MRPDPVYWVIYLVLFAIVAIWGWDFLPTKRALPKRKSRTNRKSAATSKGA